MDSIMKKNTRWILPALIALWIAFIFFHSFQPIDDSMKESGWVLALVQKILPFMSMYLVRRLAHFTEFAILGMLAAFLFGGRCTHKLSALVFAIMTGMTTALCDETIQLSSAGRSGRLQDAWLDIAGACTGALFAFAVRALWKKWRARGEKEEEPVPLP